MSAQETLGQKQRAFTQDVGQLIDFAYRCGYELTFGEAFRSDEQAEINALGQGGRERVGRLVAGFFPGLASAIMNNGKANGIRMTLHQQRLAVDLNLFIGGVYQTASEAYRSLGEFWEGLRDGNVWGGRFGDGNHFSRTHEGRR